MIEYCTGDLLQADVEAYVNTVNCVGVMGKGIALQFKHKYPWMFAQYRSACGKALVRIGRVWPWQAEDGKWIVNFPTKTHWRKPSELQYIHLGLDDLVLWVYRMSIASIAIPALGCSNGGLEWSAVRPLITRAFEALPEVSVLLYGPHKGK